jgi:hypothetical protein
VRRYVCTPAAEPLEGRRLLTSLFTGPSTSRNVESTGGIFQLSVSGPGLEEVRNLGHGQVSVKLFGTTSASTLNVALTHPRLHVPATPLQITSIKVVSGELGGIQAAPAILTGTITPLNGTVNTLQFGGLGPNAQIDVNGSLGSLSIPGVNLGPNGHVNIEGDLKQSLSVGALDITGGRFVISHDLAGSLAASSVNLSQGGQFLVGHNITGAAQVSGALSVTGNSLFSVGNNLGGLSVGQALTLDSGGQVAVGNGLTGAVTVGGDLDISNGARLIDNRDVTGSVTVTGDLALASGGMFVVGRTLNALTVDGDLTIAPAGSAIAVGGNLTNLTVQGAFIGQGSSKAIDLSVGLNLGALNVLGGSAGQGGIQNANIAVGKSILAMNVPHGIFNSFITAGVTIQGGSSSTGTTASIGPDGADAVFNSELRAGVSILNLTIGGNVRSTFAVNPSGSTGYPTRIIAGEDRAGDYINGGLIDNFQITGSLIDSVVAASVAPFGDAGTLPVNGYGPPPVVNPIPGDGGFNTYDAPAGTITGGTVGNPIKYPNWTQLNIYNETVTGVAYNTAIDPTIDDTILFGAINPSFASAPLSQAALTNDSTVVTNAGTLVNSSSSLLNGSSSTITVTPNQQVLPLPTKSTVLGGVISTKHGDEADFAGLFASDTRGVFIGPLPSS